MSALHVQLFGRCEIRQDEQHLAGLDGGKALELFCYLVLHASHLHTRESLAALLSADATPAQARKSLRQALWQLQNALEAAGPPGVPTLVVEPDWVGLNPQADLWLDAQAFEQAVTLARDVRGEGLATEHARALQDAVQLYHGDLLQGWYQDWCLYERERFQNLYFETLDKLMNYCEAHGEYENGLAYGACSLRLDRARERTHRRMMRLHYFAGDRTAALRQYERCAAALDEELGVSPAARTRALYEDIRADRLAALVPAALPASIPAFRDTRTHLEQLRARLHDFQQQVQRDLQAIETTLRDL